MPCAVPIHLCPWPLEILQDEAASGCLNPFDGANIVNQLVQTRRIGTICHHDDIVGASHFPHMLHTAPGTNLGRDAWGIDVAGDLHFDERLHEFTPCFHRKTANDPFIHEALHAGANGPFAGSQRLGQIGERCTAIGTEGSNELLIQVVHDAS